MGHDLYLDLEGGPLLLLLRSMAPKFKSMLAARNLKSFLFRLPALENKSGLLAAPYCHCSNYFIPQTHICVQCGFCGVTEIVEELNLDYEEDAVL